MPKKTIDTEIAVMKNEIHHIKDKVDKHEDLLKDIHSDFDEFRDNFNKSLDKHLNIVEKKFAGKWVERVVIAISSTMILLLLQIILAKLGLL